MEPSTTVQTPPPEAVVMQMAMGAWVTKVISEATRLSVPDLLRQQGSMTTAEMIVRHGLKADPHALERVLRACASLGIFTEDATGRFGPTALSDVLTLDSPVSVKKLVEVIGGTLYRGWIGLANALMTGQPQAQNVFGMPWWDYLNAHPKELEDFGEAMKSNSLNSIRGVLDKCDLAGVRKVVDVGGGFGHLAVALLEKYSTLQAAVLEISDLIPVARERFPVKDRSIASRLEYVGGDMFESVPPADVYIMKQIIHDWEDEKCVRLLGELPPEHGGRRSGDLCRLGHPADGQRGGHTGQTPGYYDAGPYYWQRKNGSSMEPLVSHGWLGDSERYSDP